MSFLPQDNDRLKILLAYTFGFTVLFVYAILAISIAIGHVEEKTSFGLREVLSNLGPLGGGFAVWAFGAASAAMKNKE